MPIIEQMICSGSGAATSRTISQRPSGWRSTIRCTISRVRTRTAASTRATTRGVNAF
jgi:hypothetical protein